MSHLLDQPCVAGLSAQELAAQLDRLEAGDEPRALQLQPAGLAAILTFAGLGLGDSPGPALVQNEPSRPGLRKLCGAAYWTNLLPHAGYPTTLCLAAGLFQMLDFWEASHTSAQEADDRGEHDLSVHWHAIAHRREPDPGNAAYWYRRVGRSPLNADLQKAAAALLADDPVADRKGWDRLASGPWDALLFIDLCVSARPGSPEGTLARRLQRLEMARLMDRTAQAAGLI